MGQVPGGPGSTGATAREQRARVIARFKRLGPQRKALQLAIEPFLDSERRFKSDEWEQAFAEGDEHSIYKVAAVLGTFQMLVNHCVEMLQDGVRLTGLPAGDGTEAPSARTVIEAVRADRGLTANQAALLYRMYRLRNRLQHNSPGVQADEVRDNVEALLGALGPLVQNYIDWLKRHDVDLLGS